MKRSFSIIHTIIILMLFSGIAVGQKNPGEYMQKMEDAQKQITEDFLIYTSAVAHGKSARKVEKRRKDLISSVTHARSQAKHMAPFNKTDTTLSAASYTYLNICYNLLKEDYGKIVDLEEIAEQSYDNMEAYLLAQEKASQVLDEAGDRLEATVREFAANHNVNLIEKKDANNKKAEKVGKVNAYYHQVFLVYFKSMKQEAYMIAAVSKKDVNGIEQNKNALLKSAEEGLLKLPSIKPYENDRSLATACQKLLQFYQKEVNEKVSILTDFALKSDAFDKARKSFESGSKSKADSDSYNKAVKDINDAGAVYNKTNNDLNQTRGKLNNEWDNAVKNFMDKHIPQAK